MAISLDNRVSTHEALNTLQNSGERLERAMERSGGNARDAATLSKAEFRAEIMNKGGIASEYRAVDSQVLATAAKFAGGGQVGKKELDRAVSAWQGIVKRHAQGDGFLAARDATSNGLKNIYNAVQQDAAHAQAYANRNTGCKA